MRLVYRPLQLIKYRFVGLGWGRWSLEKTDLRGEELRDLRALLRAGTRITYTGENLERECLLRLLVVVFLF